MRCELKLPGLQLSQKERYMSQRIAFEIKEGIASLTLNRPEKKNAIDDIAVKELTEYFSRADQDRDVRAIVFRSVGDVFSAGADLAYLKKLSENSSSANFEDSCALKDLLLSVYKSRKLTCSVVRGPALAGAFGLVLACDVVLASEKAKFGFTEVKVGFVPAIVMNFALRKLREADVRMLALTGKIIGPDEAVRIGLISEVVDDDVIEERVGEFLKSFVRGTSKEAVSLTKEVLADLKEMPLEQALSYSAMKNVLARSTEDFTKGVDSFLNKKQLEWK